MKFLPILATITGLSIVNSADAQLTRLPPDKTEIPNPTTVRVIENDSKLRIYDRKVITTIKASSLKVRVLNSQTCNGEKVKRQTLSGKTFFPKAIKFDKLTGNLAVGVLLQDCLKQSISAVFILQPKPNWNNYIVHRVAVPGKKQINNRFSTYPLGIIKAIGFIDGNLLIKHADLTNSEALLIYTSSSKPVGKYAGCVVTQQSKDNNICPSFQTTQSPRNTQKVIK